MRGKFQILFVTLALCGQAWAGPLEDGLNAEAHRDYATALRLLRPLAVRGDAVAQYELSGMYVLGEGVPQNYLEAAKWNLLAAEQGHLSAQYSQGLLYRAGQGVPQDYGQAVKWFRVAADRGLSEAQLALGFAYSNGQGVPQDYVVAYMWFNLSHARGGLNVSSDERDRVATKMTPAQIAEGQKLAREWKPK